MRYGVSATFMGWLERLTICSHYSIIDLNQIYCLSISLVKIYFLHDCLRRPRPLLRLSRIWWSSMASYLTVNLTR
jgi:hypothetical protein